LKNDVPCGPINTIADTTSDPHIAGAREMFVEIEHPKAGKMRLTGSHIKFSRTKSGIRTPAPLLGQHTDEILLAAGYSEDEIAQMREEGVF
jgi:formyl-CoA transferase